MRGLLFCHSPCFSSMLIIIIIIRDAHSSWASPSGLLLMGGYETRTTEKIQEDGTSSYSFDLKYDAA